MTFTGRTRIPDRWSGSINKAYSMGLRKSKEMNRKIHRNNSINNKNNKKEVSNVQK